jgi:hypothetical protein
MAAEAGALLREELAASGRVSEEAQPELGDAACIAQPAASARAAYGRRQRGGTATATAAAVEGVGSGGVATPDAPRWANTFETPGCTARPTQEELRSPCSVAGWLGLGLG